MSMGSYRAVLVRRPLRSGVYGRRHVTSRDDKRCIQGMNLLQLLSGMSDRCCCCRCYVPGSMQDRCCCATSPLRLLLLLLCRCRCCCYTTVLYGAAAAAAVVVAVVVVSCCISVESEKIIHTACCCTPSYSTSSPPFPASRVQKKLLGNLAGPNLRTVHIQIIRGPEHGLYSIQPLTGGRRGCIGSIQYAGISGRRYPQPRRNREGITGNKRIDSAQV